MRRWVRALSGSAARAASGGELGPQRARSAAVLALGVCGGICIDRCFLRAADETSAAESTAQSERSPSQSSAQQAEECHHQVREELTQKITKLQKSAQERIQWNAGDKEMLGLSPRLWLEVLDDKHRYASMLYNYFRRWQLSDTSQGFFHWLEYGQGSMIDLPASPRRLLDEWNVIYLSREQQWYFRVQIQPETGRFIWAADGKPVTLPAPPPVGGPHASGRDLAVASLLQPILDKACRRDERLAAAKAEAERARSAGEEATPQRLRALAAPLIEEGLLCQLRDPHFSERLDAAALPGAHAYLRSMGRLPSSLLPGLGWDDFLQAVAHDQGTFMKSPFPTGCERRKIHGKGIFVLDSFGTLYCFSKIRGIFHHSSFVRGHAVVVAGGLTIEDGRLVELSPHSGHYVTGEEHVNQLIEEWKQKGVDFSQVKVRPYSKV